MPFFKLSDLSIFELKSGDAIKCHRRHGTLQALYDLERFPSTTLIRLYELLKSSSRLAKADPSAEWRRLGQHRTT
jgi:hypothetical protein